MVFHVPELHERILLHLDTCTLLLAQRVSRSWQRVITTSPELQTKLFFHPLSPDASELQPYGSSSSRAILLNPFLARSFSFFFPEDQVDVERQGLGDLLLPVEFTGDISVQNAFTRPEASWRNMLVYQPAAPALVITKVEPPSREPVVERVEFGPDGLRMRGIYDTLAGFIRQRCRPNMSAFRITWPLDEEMPEDEFSESLDLGIIHADAGWNLELNIALTASNVVPGYMHHPKCSQFRSHPNV